MPLYNYTSEFLYTSKYRYRNSVNLLRGEARRLVTPYSAGIYHAHSLAYPIANIVNCAYGAFRIALGIGLLFPALVSPTEALPAAFLGIGIEIGAMLLAALNSAVSLLSLLTKSVATAFSLGYFSSDKAELKQMGYIRPDGRINILLVACAEVAERELKLLEGMNKTLDDGQSVDSILTDEVILLGTYNF